MCFLPDLLCNIFIIKNVITKTNLNINQHHSIQNPKHINVYISEDPYQLMLAKFLFKELTVLFQKQSKGFVELYNSLYIGQIISL